MMTQNNIESSALCGGRLVTFIAEYRQDAIGEYLWVVTAWHATSQEQQAYEREVQ